MEQIRQEQLQITGGEIPITLYKDVQEFVIDVDGVEWVALYDYTHAVVIFQMMVDHLTDYMNYEAIS